MTGHKAETWLSGMKFVLCSGCRRYQTLYTLMALVGQGLTPSECAKNVRRSQVMLDNTGPYSDSD